MSPEKDSDEDDEATLPDEEEVAVEADARVAAARDARRQALVAYLDAEKALGEVRLTVRAERSRSRLAAGFVG